MINRVEKLSLLSEMIAFAKVGSVRMKDVEYSFLLGVADELKISREDFEYLLEHPVKYTSLKSYSQRIVQFHRLILLMNIDGAKTQEEIGMLYNYGLRMGLSQEAISKVLYLMDGFPDNIVPPDVLIDIFKVQYN